MFKIGGVTFYFSTTFSDLSTTSSDSEVKKLENALISAFTGDNVSTFLRDYQNQSIYITPMKEQNSQYNGSSNLTSEEFYNDGTDPIKGPSSGLSISISPDLVNGQPISLAQPDGPFNPSLARILFHELSHGVTLTTAPGKISGSTDANNYFVDLITVAGHPGLIFNSRESLAVASEDLIYAKDHGQPSRAGYAGFISKSYDPAISFRDVTTVSYRRVNETPGGLSDPKNRRYGAGQHDVAAEFFGDTSDGRIIKDYWQDNYQPLYAQARNIYLPFLSLDNYVTVSGDAGTDLVNSNGGLSQTAKDVLAGIAASTARVSNILKNASSTLTYLQNVSKSLSDGALGILSDALSGAKISDANRISGISNEIFSEGGIIAGPLDVVSGSASFSKSLFLGSENIGSILVGSSGFKGKNVNFSDRTDILIGSSSQGNVLIAGSGSSDGMYNRLIGGSAADILIGGEKNDSINGGDGDDIIFQSAGTDLVDGGSGLNTLVLSDALGQETVDTNGVHALRTLISGGSGSSAYKTYFSNIQIIVGNSSKTKFIGNGHSVFVAGSGGGDFTLKPGDIAVGNPDAKGGNIYRVSSTDIGHIGIVNFGKNDRIYVDGKIFTGSSISAESLGHNTYNLSDTALATGVIYTAKSSWSMSFTQPVLSPGRFGPEWSDSGGELKMVTYTPSSDQSAGPSGDIYFTHAQVEAGSGELSSTAALDLSITGWNQGDGGINFLENNLAREALGRATAFGGFYAQDPGSLPGTYSEDGVIENEVGGLFGPTSTEWSSGAAAGTQSDTLGTIAALVAADVSKQAADLPESDPIITSNPHSGGGGGGPSGPPSFFENSDSGQSHDVVDGTDSTDVMAGDGNANTFDPQGTFTNIIGGGGGDTIYYSTGYGLVVIDEVDSNAQPVNELRFTADITPSRVSVRADADGDILLDIGDEGDDQVVLLGALNSSEGLTRGVQLVSFADGTAWTYADILGKVETASNTNRVIYGDSGSNLLDTEGLAATAVGNGGGDTFKYDAGYGSVTIDERDASIVAQNKLNFGEGIDPYLANVYGQSDGSIVIDFGSGDKVTLANALLSTSSETYGVQNVEFFDGTTWSYSDLLDKADTPSLNNLTLYGDRSPNILDGEGIATSISGGGGGDTFDYWDGDAPLTIYEADTAIQPNNSIFLANIDPDDLSVRADGFGNIVLETSDGDRVTIANALNSTNEISYGVQTIQFDNGATWSYSDLLARADTAAADNTDLYGDGKSNVIDAAGIARSISGGGGGDTFVYNRGYGALSITEVDFDISDINVLQFGSGIAATDIAVTGSQSGDLILSLGNGDVVTLVGALINSSSHSNGVQSVTFSDGTTWAYADLLALAETSGLPGSTIYGDAGSNLLDSHGVASTAVGGGGGDTFVYNAGYGALTIDEVDQSETPGNVLMFGSGIDPAMVGVSGTDDGAIVLSLGETDVVTLSKALDSDGYSAYGVQTVNFANGTSWTYADLLTKVETAASGVAAIHGDGAANTLDPAGTAATVVGGGGGDTILFNQGYGAVTIDERDLTGGRDNILQIGAGIDPGSVTVSANAAGDILLNAGNGDQVTLKGALFSDKNTTYGVQGLDFADGTVWSYDDLLAKVDTPTAGMAALYGDTGANVLDGQGVVQQLVGNGGDDTFVYQQGYGQLTIDEQDAGGYPDNRLQLGTGLTPAATQVTANAAGDIILTFGGSDQVIQKGMLNSDSTTARGVQEVDFANGTVWTYDDLLSQADTASATNTTLYGDAYVNNFDSAGLAHEIIGKGGGDTFAYDRGYGALSIDEQDSSADPLNTLAFGSGITPGDVAVSTTMAGDILLSLGGGDAITLVGAAVPGGGITRGVQSVNFDGGSSWSGAQLQALAIGAWEIADNGQQTNIDESLNFSATVPTINLAFASTAASVAYDSGRDGITLTSANGTSITIDDILIKGIGSAQTLHFSDGVTWTLSQAISQAAVDDDTSNYELGTSVGENFDFAHGVEMTIGGGGGDSFQYDLGDGSVHVSEVDQSSSPNNVLNFGTGISLSDLSVTSDGQSLFLGLPNGDVVTIDNALTSTAGTALGVQSVNFFDGTSATYAQLLQMADTGSPTNDWQLYGDANANVIDPAGYANYIVGGGGSDTIVYNDGYGDLEIADGEKTDGSDAVIAFGAGITESDLDIEADPDDQYGLHQVDIRVNTANNIGEISIDEELSSPTPIIAGLTFVDGTSMSYADILAAMETPKVGKALINGDSSANTLDTQGLVHEVMGFGGGDTFMYNRGYGTLSIIEDDTSETPANKLVFGAGINPEDVSVKIVGANYQLSLNDNDYVTFAAAQLTSTTEGVQTVEFADGTTWNTDDLARLVNTGNVQKPVIVGTYLNEMFDGLGLSHEIMGESGSDTYVFNRGYGALTIEDSSYTGPPSNSKPPMDTNTLQIGSDIDPDDVSVTAYGEDVVLSVGAFDRVILKNQLSDINGFQQGVEQVTFANGTIWSAADLLSKLPGAPTGSAATVDPGSVVQGAVTLPVSTATALSVNGSIQFEDADVGDVHSVTIVAASAPQNVYAFTPADTARYLSYLSASVASEPNSGTTGAINWSFYAPSAGFSDLAPGQSTSIQFTLLIQDQNGATASQNVTVNVSVGIDGSPSTAHVAGTSGNDTISLAGNQIVDPGTGDDMLTASSNGGSTIEFAKGDGHDELTGQGFYSRGENLLLTDTNPDDVSVSSSGNALTLHIDATGDSFRADSQINSWDDTTGSLREVAFADGSVWDRIELANRVAGTEVDINTPDQMIDASSDIDTFVVGGSIGDTTITNFDAASDEHDYLEVNRSQFSDWAHLLGATQQVGSDLVITLDANDTVRLAGVSMTGFSEKDVKFTGTLAA